MKISTDIGVWIGALAAIAIYSVLIKDNPVYTMIEHIFVGASAGIAVVVGVNTFLNSAWSPMIGGNYLLLVPILIGLLLYSRYFENIAWLNRVPLSFLMGTGAGVAMRGAVESQIVQQISATMVSLTTFNAWVVFLGTVFSLSYFFLTFKRGKVTGVTSQLGRYFMMAAFGAAFGNTVMGRVSAAIGRFQFIFLKWLGLG
ncbi:MAG: hypothetical protein KBI40_03535 [Firmicutes bacterium]|jgi:hypothetical protein|nr:hypothetical protein [Candidatus Fermentithermobacillaceae bacterium]